MLTTVFIKSKTLLFELMRPLSFLASNTWIHLCVTSNLASLMVIEIVVIIMSMKPYAHDKVHPQASSNDVHVYFTSQNYTFYQSWRNWFLSRFLIIFTYRFFLILKGSVFENYIDTYICSIGQRAYAQEH